MGKIPFVKATNDVLMSVGSIASVNVHRHGMQLLQGAD